jgi:hypothetical protein
MKSFWVSCTSYCLFWCSFFARPFVGILALVQQIPCWSLSKKYEERIQPQLHCSCYSCLTGTREQLQAMFLLHLLNWLVRILTNGLSLPDMLKQNRRIDWRLLARTRTLAWGGFDNRLI